MTNYNDGNWHGWNGGECPVHPKTIVKVIFGDGSSGENTADYFNWSVVHFPVGFRVVKEHKEPREFLVHPRNGAIRKLDVEDEHYKRLGYIHVREVID